MSEPDPPWLDEAVDHLWLNCGLLPPTARAVITIVLAFAARQPRDITDAMVDVAQENLRTNASPFSRAGVRAALEAAAKAR